jgi:hypothetical protein
MHEIEFTEIESQKSESDCNSETYFVGAFSYANCTLAALRHSDRDYWNRVRPSSANGLSLLLRGSPQTPTTAART